MVAWSDSALYNSYDETDIHTDEQLRLLEKQLVRSQHGALVGFASKGSLTSSAPAITSPVDWVSHASRRVVTSTFAAETAAAIEAMGRALYVRAMAAELIKGQVKLPHQWNEKEVPLYLLTDCKSLYDNVQKDCSLCDDRHTAPYIASLRQSVSAGPQRDKTRAGMMWVPSRHQLADGLTKAGLCETLRACLRCGTALFHEESAQELRRRQNAYRARESQQDDSVSSEGSETTELASTPWD